MSRVEQVVLVDENDKVLGIEDKMRAHELALLHRAFSVFVYRKNNGFIEILLQQRHRDKYHCGGLWTNTCCSHPRLGEEIIEAAERRLKEEMGIQAILTPCGIFQYTATFNNGLTENEIDHVFLGWFDGTPFTTNLSEISEWMWISHDELQKNILLTPDRYTPWLRPALEKLLPQLLR